MQGWIKLHRGITSHWIFKDADKFKAWITILATVNHTENKTVIGDALFVIKRGESIKSLDTWAKLFGLGWNKSKVRRFFKLLESDSMIETKSERKTTRLIVCNYDSYQGERNDSETIMKQSCNDDETIVTPNKNVKKEKNEKNKKETNGERVEFDKLKDFFNSSCLNFPSIQKITNSRKTAVNARIKETSKQDFIKVIKLASESSFLNGDNDRGWIADFDWMIKPSNYMKILEGNYSKDNKQVKKDTYKPNEDWKKDIRK